MRYKDLIHKKFGRWLVIKLDSKTDKQGRHFWVCRCDCGNEKIVGGHHLVNGGSKSCGCYNNEMRLKNLLPGEAGFNYLIHSYKKNARERKLKYDLLDKEFKDLVTKNCHYCGSIPSRKIKSESKHSTFTCNGIDRKDNSKGYIKENCVPCCEKCNIMKYTYSEKEFLNQCSLIARQDLLRSSFV